MVHTIKHQQVLTHFFVYFSSSFLLGFFLGGFHFGDDDEGEEEVEEEAAAALSLFLSFSLSLSHASPSALVSDGCRAANPGHEEDDGKGPAQYI